MKAGVSAYINPGILLAKISCLAFLLPWYWKLVPNNISYQMSNQAREHQNKQALVKVLEEVSGARQSSNKRRVRSTTIICVPNM